MKYAPYILMTLGSVGCASTVRGGTSVPPRDDVPVVRDVATDTQPDVASDQVDAGSDASPDVFTLDTGEDASADVVVDAAPDVAPDTTPVVPDLRISLASTPTSATYVKRSLNIPTVGLLFTASRRVLLQDLPLVGMGNTSGTFLRGHFHDVAVSCGIFDGMRQIGSSRIPEVVDGSMMLRGINFTIEPGMSRLLVVKCTADSVVTHREVGDQMVVGVGDLSQLLVRRDDGTNATIELDNGLRDQINGSTSRVIITIIERGMLEVMPDSLRRSTILVAGGDVWHNIAQYRATARYEDGIIDRANILVAGDSASYSTIAVSVDGAVRGWEIPPSGVNQNRDVDLTSNPILVPRDTSVRFQLWGRFNPVVAPSSVTSRVGVPLSGAQVALGINARLTGGEWDNPLYATSYNIRTTGATSGERIFVAAERAAMGNPFIVRKTKIVVQTVTVGSHELVRSGRQALMSNRIAADVAGAAGLKKIGFTIRIGRAPGSRMSVGSLRLQLNGSDLSDRDYRIIRLVGGSDVMNATFGATEETVDVVVIFNAEETISGTGAEYTLTADVQNSEIGDSISTSLIVRGSSSVTGTLTDDSFMIPLAGGTMGPFILPPYSGMGPIEQIWRVHGDQLIWTDRSDVPHGRTSLDWIGDTYIEDLTVRNTVARTMP